MLSNILLGFALGFLVSGIGYYFIQKPYQELGKVDENQIKKKVVNRYLLRNFGNLLFLFIIFKTTNTATLVAAAVGLTMVRNYLIAKQYLAGKG